MMPLIIIPARGGSKGIPRKNIKPLGGKPLIEYTIDVARQYCRSHGIDEKMIVVSTDSEEIIQTARKAGVHTDYMRPDALGADNVGSREVMIDVMDWADSRHMVYDTVILLQPTSPFRTVEDVERTVDEYEKSHPDMAVTIKEASANPYYNCFETAPDGSLHISKGDGRLTRRQDAPRAWEFNGAVYVIRPSSLRKMPMGDFPLRVGVEMPPERSIDLDTPLDWIVAEAILTRSPSL